MEMQLLGNARLVLDHAKLAKDQIPLTAQAVTTPKRKLSILPMHALALQVTTTPWAATQCSDSNVTRRVIHVTTLVTTTDYPVLIPTSCNHLRILRHVHRLDRCSTSVIPTQGLAISALRTVKRAKMQVRIPA